MVYYLATGNPMAGSIAAAGAAFILPIAIAATSRLGK